MTTPFVAERQFQLLGSELGLRFSVPVLLCGLLGSTPNGLAGPQTLLSRPPRADELAQAAISDQNFDGTSLNSVRQQMADRFSLPVAATVSDVTWSGFYPVPAAPPPTGAILFQVRFFTDDGGVPSLAPLYERVLLADASPFLVVQGRQTYAYHAELALPFSLEPQTSYWLSVVEDDPRTTVGAFRWFSADTWTPVGSAWRSVDATAWRVTANGPQMGFSLSGYTVPEPSWAGVFSLGVPLLLVGRWFGNTAQAWPSDGGNFTQP